MTVSALRQGSGSSNVPLIELTGVSRTYPGPPAVHALAPVDLIVHAGEYVAVVGASGSGKSTLLNVLGLLDAPTSGRYRLDGTDTHRLGDAGRTALRAGAIGFVFQEFHLLAHRSVLDNVALGQLYTGVRAPQRLAQARQVLCRVGLGDRLHALPTQLSGGQRQRVAIARALVNHPRLLLCDEPTGNLDSATAAAVMDLVGDLHTDGVTVLLITHDPITAARAGRRLTVSDGFVVDDRSTDPHPPGADA